jgi:hypothetical protein
MEDRAMRVVLVAKPSMEKKYSSNQAGTTEKRSRTREV